MIGKNTLSPTIFMVKGWRSYQLLVSWDLSRCLMCKQTELPPLLHFVTTRHVSFEIRQILERICMLTGKINYSNASDSELMTLLRQGDHTAYNEIYNRYYYLVFVYGYKKLRDRDQTKDIVQELFVDLWVKKGAIFTARNLASYLITSVRNKIFDLFEHQIVESKYIESLKSYANTGNIAHTDYLIREKQLTEYIEKEIQALPKKMRRIFELSRKNNLSNKRIAEKLNTSESNVSQHLSNATKILRAKLGSILFLWM